MAVSYPLLALLVFLAVKDDEDSSVSSDELGGQDAICASQIYTCGQIEQRRIYSYKTRTCMMHAYIYFLVVVVVLEEF